MLPHRLIIFFLVPLLAVAQNVSLRGVAINAFSRQPIPKVHIRLLKVSSYMPGDVYGAMSDDAGHFSIANVSPGAYYVIPEHAGFVPTPSAKNPKDYAGVTLKAGENISNFRVELTPASTIRVRVVDEYGDPLGRVWVGIEAESESNPSFRMHPWGIQPGVASFQTDDRGEFAATGLPGKYYISANDFRGSHGAARNEIRTDGTSDPVYVRTWFPNSASMEGATLIEVKPGEEMLPIEIRMRRRQSFSISGVVSGLPAGAHPIVDLIDTASADGLTYGSRGDEDGHFSFGRLAPGSYRLFATYVSQETVLQSPLQPVTISSADVGGVVLALTELTEIAGVVEVARSKSVLRGTIRVTSRGPFAFAASRSPVPIEKDGSFRVGRVSATRYEIAIDPLPENAFIQSVTVDGVAQAGRAGFDIPSGARTAALKIIVNLNGGQLSGTIVDRDGSVITGGTSTVYLADDPKDMAGARFTRVKQDGSYLIQGIRPGKYHLFVIDLFRSPGGGDGGRRGQEALGDLAARGEEIEIQAGDRLTRKLTPVYTEDANAKPRP